jgi:hypothetical protein
LGDRVGRLNVDRQSGVDNPLYAHLFLLLRGTSAGTVQTAFAQEYTKTGTFGLERLLHFLQTSRRPQGAPDFQLSTSSPYARMTLCCPLLAMFFQPNLILFAKSRVT